MNERPNNHNPSLRPSLRFFFDEGKSEWKPIGSKKFLDIRDGKFCVPKRSGKNMRVAVATVEIEGRTLVVLRNLTISEWKIGDNGFVDQEVLMAGIAKWIDGGTGKAGYITPAPEDFEAIKRCLGLGGV
ncbi:MAG: hypothetical protein WAW02_07160 [Sideroxyarcus sp.]